MPLRLYNSLTRTVEEFVPRDDKRVNMFVCGPTVYDRVHLGNARTFTVFDVVAKWLRHRGYDVHYIQNITDIDDRIIARAAEQQREPLGYAHEFDQKFRDDMQALGNDAVTTFAPATEYIPQVIQQVKTLIAKDHVYKIDGDGWYFDLSTFPDYGKLSGRTAAAAEDAVSRIDDSSKKRNTGDFCVWKFSKDHEPSWPDNELGAGRPGWHIEDTAITEHFFGPQYDLHGGGMDLKFPHHEAEIAQQESASGKMPFVKYWMHVGFLEMGKEKMSKSLGNFMTVHDALAQYPAEVVRFFLLSNHYRAPLEMTDDSLKAASAAIARISELLYKLDSAPTSAKDDSALLQAIAEATGMFTDAMDDDCNMPQALAAAFSLITETNSAFTQERVGTESRNQLREFFAFVHTQLGIVPKGGAAFPTDVQKLVDARVTAREQKDFVAADKLRDELSTLGYTVDDTPYGPLVKKK